MLQGKEYLFLFVCFPDEEGEIYYPSAHCFAEKGLNLFQAGEPFYPRRLIDILVNGTFTTYSVHLAQLGKYNLDGKWNVWKILKWAFNRCFSDKTLSSRSWNILLNFEYFLCFPKTNSKWPGCLNLELLGAPHISDYWKKMFFGNVQYLISSLPEWETPQYSEFK